MNEVENVCFQIITNAGIAKSKYFNAIECVKKGDLDLADELINEANESLLNAHLIHSKLIKEEAAGNVVNMTLLLSHSEDLMMSAELTKDFALIIIDLFQNYNITKKEIKN